jgi:hypothetical protein
MELITVFEAASEEVNRVTEVLRIANRKETDQKDTLQSEEQRLKMMSASGKDDSEIEAQNEKIEKSQAEYDKLLVSKTEVEEELR